MKILEVNKFNYLKGGADRHFLELVELLKAQGNDVAVFAMDDPKNKFSPWSKYFVSYVGYGADDALWSKIKGALTRFYSWEAKRKMRKMLRDFEPELVHIHNIYHQISPSILPEIKKRNIPIVMTVHDNKLVYPHYLPPSDENAVRDFGFFDFVWKRKFKNSALKSFLVALEFEIVRYFNLYDKYIDAYLVPSQFTKNKLIEGGISEKKIIVLPHFSFLQNPVEKNELGQKEKYVLHYGRLSKDKGVDRLIEIFRNLPEVNLYLAGKIEDDLKIPKLSNIKYLGFLSPKEIEKLIENALFVVSASTLWETFGLVALEAMLGGKPFVGFSGGAYAEIIEDNYSGFLVRDEAEMREKIERLACDENLRKTLGQNARERAKLFSRETYYPKILGVFQKLTKVR